MNEFIKFDTCILTLDEKPFAKLLLYEDGRFAFVKFISVSKCFDGQLM